LFVSRITDKLLYQFSQHSVQKWLTGHRETIRFLLKLES